MAAFVQRRWDHLVEPPSSEQELDRDKRFFEFCITDEHGKALVITGAYKEFQFPMTSEEQKDPARQQAVPFVSLLQSQSESVAVVQEAKKRVVDDLFFKYVGVGSAPGDQEARIVEVGNRAELLDQFTSELFIGALIVAVFLLVFGFLASILLARMVTRPIEYLKDAAERISRRPEDYDPADLRKVRVRRDELGQLARAFDHMANELQAGFLLLFKSMRSAVLRLDSKYRITYANPYASELFGYSKDELIGQHMKLIVPEHELEQIMKSLASLRDSNQDLNTNENVRKDGGRLLNINENVRKDGESASRLLV